MAQMRQTLAPGSAGKSGAQITCGWTEMHRMCICEGESVITDSGPLPWGQVETHQLQIFTEKSREKKEASKFKLIHKPHCFLIIKPPSPQNQSKGKYKIMGLLCYPDTPFLKRRDYNLLMRNRNGICIHWELVFPVIFTYFVHVWLLHHQWLKKVSVYADTLQNLPEYVSHKCTYIKLLSLWSQ